MTAARRPRVARAAGALLALGTLLGAAPLAAKDFYVTVRRDFGPDEPPAVELHFSQGAPFLLRVYRPKDLKEFVTSQVDLRRAWRRPKVELNSARFLFKGLNKTSLDLDWLRAASSYELREALRSEYGGAAWTPGKTRLSEGPERLISGPDRFELVSEASFFPDADDAKTPFDVPGFDWWFGSEGRLRQRTVRLPRLSPGFYLVQAMQGMSEGQGLLVVNDLSASIQQTDGAALVRVTRRDGRPAPGAEVEVKNLQGAWVAKGKTNADGVLSFPDLKDTELVAVIREKESVAIVDTEFFSSSASFPDVYLYTDRPLYKKTSLVRFKGILRRPLEGLSRLWASLSGGPTSADVSIKALDGAAITGEVKAPISRFGTFHGEFDLGYEPEDLNGLYRVSANAGGATHIGEFRVQEYVKPLFFFKVKTEQETLKAGGELRAAVSIERYAGGVPRGVKYQAQLFRVRAQSPAWVEDAGLGETGSATTYGWDAASKGRQESVSVPYLVASESDLVFDAQGRSTLTLTLPEKLPGPPNFDYNFVLRLYALDPDGNSASFSKSFADLRSEVVALARMSAVYADPERPATLSVRAVHPSGKPYGKTKGSIAWTLRPYRKTPTTRETGFTTGEDGRYRVSVPANEPGRLDVVVTLWDRFEKTTTTEASIVVAPKTPGAPITDVSEISILQERDTYAPGETARALVLLPDGWGEKGTDSGRLYLTVAGRGIHAQRVQPVTGLSAWITQPIEPSFGTAAYVVLSYPDPARGWVERTLTFRVPPADKRLTVAVSPQAPFLRPGQKQGLRLKVTDAAGKPVEAEVSVSVVDKAVLAIQPEFRPSLLSFFYPTERLNLMSFFSREFQSYGYGERLAQRFGPNFWMAQTKPDKKKDRDDDTAYWNPRVLTDSDGLAAVSFRLPGNQTTWNVSAVAVDTRGRFGEGGAEFGTNAPVTLQLAAPTFLRAGDRAGVRLLLANPGGKARDVRANVAAPAGLTLDTPVTVTTTLQPKAESSARGSVALASASTAGTATLTTTLDLGGEAQRFDHPLRTLPATVSSVERRNVSPNEAIAVSAGPGETVTSVRFVAATRFVEAFVPALRWLLAYPYGCAEQVASTTVPSLLVQKLFARSAIPLTEAERATTIRPATEFAAAGVARLKAMQRPDGSFSWWTGEPDGNPTMTALVLTLFASLDDPDALKALDAKKALGALKAKTPPGASSLGVTVLWLESRLALLGVVPQPGNTAEANARFLADWVVEKGTLLDKARFLLALKGLGYDEKPGLSKSVRSLLDELDAAVTGQLGATTAASAAEPSRVTPLQTDWPGYPGRLGSTLATAGRTLQAYRRLDDARKKKLSRRLLGGFDGRHFGSTFETSLTLADSAWLLEEEIGRVETHRQVRVKVGSETLRETALRYQPLSTGVEIGIDPKDALRGPLTFDGLTDDHVARLVVTKEVPLDRVAPVEGGWGLTKELFRLDEKTGAATPLTGPVKVGDLVYVKVSFDASSRRKLPWWRSSYYALTDQVPAGFTVIEEDKAYDGKPFDLKLREARFARRDVRTDRIQWFFSFDRGFMDRGHQVGYVMRAQHPGDFAAGVARIEDFYDEALFSQTASRRVAVDALPERGVR